MLEVELPLRDRLALDNMTHVVLLNSIGDTNLDISSAGVHRVHTVEVSHLGLLASWSDLLKRKNKVKVGASQGTIWGRMPGEGSKRCAEGGETTFYRPRPATSFEEETTTQGRVTVECWGNVEETAKDRVPRSHDGNVTDDRQKSPGRPRLPASCSCCEPGTKEIVNSDAVHQRWAFRFHMPIT